MTEAQRITAAIEDDRAYLADLHKRIEWREKNLARQMQRLDQAKRGDSLDNPAELMGLISIAKASIETEKREAVQLKSEIATMEKTL